MAQAKKSELHKITSLKGESPAREGNGATYQKSFAHQSQRHHQKDPPVTALVVKGSEPTRRGNILVPILLTSQRPKDGSLGSDALVNIDGVPVVPQPIFFIQVNLQQGQMTPIPEGSTCSLVPYSYSRDRPIRHSYVKSKRSKSGKTPSRDWLQNSFQKNDSATLMQNDSRQDVSEVLDDDDNRLNKSMKRNPRKKGKKKGKHSKVFTQREVCNEKETVLERSMHVMPTAETPVNTVSCSTDISENNSSHTSISSCLSVQILNEKPEGEEYSYNHINYVGTSSPMATSNSDEMIEVEPTGSFSDEFVCDNYHRNMEGCTEHSSNQACSSPTAQADGMVPYAASKNNGVHSNKSSSCDDTFCDYYSGLDNSPVTDLLVDDWGSDNCNSYHDNSVNTNPCLKEGDRFTPAEYQVDFTFRRTSDLLDVEMPASDRISEYNEKNRISCGRTGYVSVNEACSVSKACTTVSQQCIPGKRGRHGRKSVSTCSSTHWSGNSANLGKVGKDGGHSVWQKVEKKGVEPCIPNRNLKVSSLESDARENSACMKNKPLFLSQLNESDNFCNLEEPPSHSNGLSVTCNFDNSSGLHYKPESANLSSNLPRRVKRSPAPSLKHESNQYSRKVSPFCKTNSTKQPVGTVYQNEEIGKPAGLGCEKSEISDPKFLYRSDNSKSDFSPIEGIDARPRLEDENIPVSISTLEHPYSNVNGTATQIGKDQFNPSAREVDSWQHQYRHNVQSEGGSYILYKEDGVSQQNSVSDSVADMRMDTRSFHLESRHDHTSGAIMQKWVPVGKKGSGMSSRDHHDNLFVSPKDLSSQKSGFEDNIQTLDPGFDPDSIFTTATSLSKCAGFPNATTSTCSKIDAGAGSMFASTIPLSSKLIAGNDTLNANRKLGMEEVDSFSVLTDMEKIVHAVSDACKFQNASERISLHIGIPVAEFERVLYSASPVISQMHYVAHCKPCSSGQPMGSPLCCHQLPNISIRNIWRWYEQPGSYGLEVKVGDQHLKRPVASQMRFRAYFVPYLSAIQLFGITSGKNKGSCKAEKSTSPPPLSSLPIFSLLLPQPDKKEYELRANCISSSEEDNLSDISINKMEEDGELLFEYFESDPPQQRRPLFEKVRDLARGGYSNSKVFGDPSKLESLNLHDIHPASWFSVAWYPIYRIPDGNFRAAFLTYHSLGTFFHRDAKLTSSSSFDVVSPVVGLQSYNAKGECWFQLNEHESMMTQSEDHFSNLSFILKERLRSLEQAASVMARASVCKNGEKSANRQPDYEFFLSRRG